VYSFEKLLHAFDRGVDTLNASREDAVKSVAEIEGLKVNGLIKAKINTTLTGVLLMPSRVLPPWVSR
jgi:hypothetical protein